MTKPTPTQTTAERFRELWYSFDCEDHYAPDTNIVPQIIEFIASETAQAKREAREEIIEYIRTKYAFQNVSQDSSYDIGGNHRAQTIMYDLRDNLSLSTEGKNRYEKESNQYTHRRILHL